MVFSTSFKAFIIIIPYFNSCKTFISKNLFTDDVKLIVILPRMIEKAKDNNSAVIHFKIFFKTPKYLNKKIIF